ncbi:MAG: SLC13 family permease [Planctomycetes bacterium]|nr:SLC13 family permease [Planctomycetota bacterium]
MFDPAAGAEETGRAKPRAAAICAVLGLVAWLLPLGLDQSARGTLAVLVTVGGLWLTEALPLGTSALLVPVLALLLGVCDAKTAFSGFGDPIVFMFFGTFLLTDAAHRHGLDRRLADSVMTSRWVQASPRRLLFAIAFLGCAISAWINNTATTALLLPLAMTADRLGSKRFLVSVLLMTAYAPSLGGLATPVGTAPNLIGLAQIEKFTGSRPSFAEWTLMFAPLAILATVGSAAWLAWRGGRVAMKQMPEATHEIRTTWSRAERWLVVVFAFVIVLWIAPGLFGAIDSLKSAPWVKTWKDRFPEAAVPLAGGVLLFLLPATKAATGRVADRITDASAFRRLDWSTILLFGGGISLGTMLEKSGLAKTMGQGIFDAMPIHGGFGITLAATLVAIFVSELTSNTASAALVVPIVLELAKAAGVNPLGPALAATIGCSFGFMLPVSTPPNALVYGTGKLTLRDMASCGLALDVAGAFLVAGWVTLVV